MRYVAIGDSFTEGVGDELPDGTVRGWADLVAAGLATAAGEPVRYANLAVRGRLLDRIATEQVDAALALDPPPTLVTFNGGGNDMMRPGLDGTHLLDLTERAVRRLTGSGAEVVLLSGPDPSARLPFGSTLHQRGEALTRQLAALAERCDVRFVSAFDDVEVRRAVYWSPDRLHLGPAGHRRVAGLVLRALGHDVAAHVVDPGPEAPRRLGAEARYYREHVLPWVQRRLRGRSSGDDRTGKHGEWATVPPEPVEPAPAG